MNRFITGYHLDEYHDWVAELSCGHGQHVRHQPPFVNRPWVVTEEGRSAQLGSTLYCVRCDALELPCGLQCVASSVGIRSMHELAQFLTKEQLGTPPSALGEMTTAEWMILNINTGAITIEVEIPQKQPQGDRIASQSPESHANYITRSMGLAAQGESQIRPQPSGATPLVDSLSIDSWSTISLSVTSVVLVPDFTYRLTFSDDAVCSINLMR